MAWTPNDIDQFAKDALEKNLGPTELTLLYGSEGATVDKCYKLKRRLRLFGIAGVMSQANRPKEAESAQPKETHTYADAGNVHKIELEGTHIHTEEQLFAHYGIDPHIWEVKQMKVGTWTMGYVCQEVKTTSKDDEGVETSVKERKAGSKPQYKMEATLVKRKHVELMKQILAEIKEEAKTYAPDYREFKLPTGIAQTERLLEISIPDLHMGKLAWAPESGDNYDLDIAEQVFNEALDTLVARATASGGFSQIVFPVGNDLMQMDGPENMTTGGTVVDVDGRYPKVYLRTFRMIRSAIERLSVIAPVHVPVVGGNHDRLSMFHLGCLLEVAFEKSQDVVIDNSPMSRKYFKYGHNLFMYVHGDKEKVAELPNIMATERPKDWGDTLFRFIKLGHLHKKKTYSRVDVDEKYGVQTMICPSLCGTDEWHNANGYVGNLKRAEAYIHDCYDGLEGYFTYRPKRSY